MRRILVCAVVEPVKIARFGGFHQAKFLCDLRLRERGYRQDELLCDGHMIIPVGHRHGQRDNLCRITRQRAVHITAVGRDFNHIRVAARHRKGVIAIIRNSCAARNRELEIRYDVCRIDCILRAKAGDLVRCGENFSEITNNLRNSDPYMVLADFKDYRRAQHTVQELYKQKQTWNRMSLMNISNAGIFSADRSIMDYSRDIWGATPVK